MTLGNFLDGATWRSRLHVNGGANFTQWNTGAGVTVSRLLAIGDTSNGYNGWNGQKYRNAIHNQIPPPPSSSWAKRSSTRSSTSLGLAGFGI